MKFLVTGANGFVGSYLLREIIKNGDEPIAVVRDKSSNIDRISSIKGLRIIFCSLDEIDTLPKLIEDNDIEACINLAWEAANGKGHADYYLQINNIINTLKLCEALHTIGVKRFVGIGTLTENEVASYLPERGATPGIGSCYAIAKLSAQYFSKTVCTKLGIEHIWCRLANIYGVGDRTNNFINFACKTMLKGERASFTEGKQLYDFVYIEDEVRAIYLAAKKGHKNTCYFLGSNQEKPLREYIEIIRNKIDPGIQLYLGEVPFNGNYLPKSEFDASDIRNDTGFIPNITFDEGISKTINWLKEDII